MLKVKIFDKAISKTYFYPNEGGLNSNRGQHGFEAWFLMLDRNDLHQQINSLLLIDLTQRE